jgi:hypothetical protein
MWGVLSEERTGMSFAIAAGGWSSLYSLGTDRAENSFKQFQTVTPLMFVTQPLPNSGCFSRSTVLWANMPQCFATDHAIKRYVTYAFMLKWLSEVRTEMLRVSKVLYVSITWHKDKQWCYGTCSAILMERDSSANTTRRSCGFIGGQTFNFH